MDGEPDMSTYLGIDITPVLGSLFWGTLVSMIFTGFTILQAYHYFPSKDRQVVQLIALSMIILDLFSAALVAHALNYYLLPNFGSTIPFDRLVPTLAAECIVTTCIITISQLYFAWQIYGFAQVPFVKYVVSGAVVVLSLLGFAGGIGCSVVMFIHASSILTTRNHFFNALAGVAKAPAALADVIATSALCYSLGYARTGIRATDSVLKTLIGFVTQRSLLVTLTQTALLVIFYTSSSHLYWLGLHVNVTRVYANTFFAMLNGREGLKKELEIKSIAASGFGTYNHTRLDGAFRISKGTDVEADGIEITKGVWMETVQGGNSAEALGVTQIQVDHKVMVSEM